jgi:sulfoxide reductase heme-binding subunit YedZ
VNVAPHIFWLLSRAAGSVALVTASVSVGVGLLVGMRLAVPGRRNLVPIHEATALVTLAFTALHAFALLGDGFVHLGLAGIAVPFAGGYRPLWTALGIVSAYGLAVLGISYYARDRIGTARWRRLHRLTAGFWVLAVAHTVGTGTDAGSAWFLASCGIVVVPAFALMVERWLPHGHAEAPAPSRKAWRTAETGQAANDAQSSSGAIEAG